MTMRSVVKPQLRYAIGSAHLGSSCLMARGHLTFKETDVVRAIKSARKAGLHVAGSEINPTTGSIVVHVGKPTEESLTGNPWDAK